MNFLSWRIAGPALLIAVGAAGIAALGFDNARLRRRLSGRQEQQERAAHLRAENKRFATLLAQTQADAAEGARAIHAEVERARAELATLERSAVEKQQRRQAKAATDAQALAANHDPAQGLTRLEHCRNVGQATPSAAYQTLVWAALKGDDAMMAQLSTITPAARAQAEAMITRLPEAARARWTPEKIAALFFTGLMNEVSATQVLSEVAGEPQHAALNLRLMAGDREITSSLQWQLGSAGWQVVFDEKLLAAVQKKMARAEMSSSEH